MTVAMGGAALSPGAGSPARGGAGGGDEDDAAAEHARDVAAVALLAAGIDADDKHPEKRAKVCGGGGKEGGLDQLMGQTHLYARARAGRLQALLGARARGAQGRVPHAAPLAAAGVWRVCGRGLPCSRRVLSAASLLQEMIWRKWQKAPENPLNQPNARLGGGP